MITVELVLAIHQAVYANPYCNQHIHALKGVVLQHDQIKTVATAVIGVVSFLHDLIGLKLQYFLAQPLIEG